MQQSLPDLETAGVQVVGVSYDSVETLKEFADGAGITFPLLSDPDSVVIHAYQLHNQKGYPHPATLLIDQQQTVYAKLIRDGYIQRHTPEELIEAVQKLN